jgi:hypothetical protein
VSGPGAEGSTGPLARLVARPQDFLRSWPEQPLLWRSDRAFTDLLNPADADVLVEERSLRLPSFRVICAGSTLPTTSYTQAARMGQASVADLAHPGKVGELVAAGATLVLQGLHRTWEPLVCFCRALAGELGHPVQANAYLTPRQSQGFEFHYDTHDVFILQVTGRKAWVVHEPVFPLPLPDQPWPSRPESTTRSLPPPGEPHLDVILEPGDCLWLPRGWVHAARTEGDVSLHITLGVLTRTRHWLLRQIVEELAEEEGFRASLPPRFATTGPGLAGSVREVAALFDAWAAAADVDATAGTVRRRHLEQMPGPLRRPVASALNAPTIEDGTWLRVRSDAVHDVHVDESGLVLGLGDRELRLPGWLQPAVSVILTRERLRPADLKEALDAHDRLVLTRRLCREGLVEVE